MKNTYYMIEIITNYMYNELEEHSKNLGSMIRLLRHYLDCDIHYEVKHNKDKIYTLYKVVEEDGKDSWYDMIKTISVEDYLYMSYEEREKFFKV